VVGLMVAIGMRRILPPAILPHHLHHVNNPALPP
jgi:hypothetical protein